MIHADLSLRAQPGLLLVPKMLQSIEVLQLATADLVDLIARELAANETLELVAGEGMAPGRPAAPGPAGHADDGWDPRRASRAEDDGDGRQALLENVAATRDGLLLHIREQLAWWNVAPELRDRVLALAEHLDERGFLVGSDEELLEAVQGEALHEAMAVLRELDPRGIGARDVVDALLLQVPEHDPDHADIKALLTRHLEALASNKLPEVARLLGRSVADVQALLERIRRLDRYPAARFFDAVAQPVRPDLVVWFREGQMEILVNDSDLPSLGINEDYAAMLRAPRVAAEVKRYLRPKLDAARGLIRAVEQRRRTLARVGAAVLEHQRPFLSEGRAALRPLRMAEIAAALDLHTSTVSRAVNGKYVQTDLGIFRLRDFFDGGRAAPSGAGGDRAGRLGIQQRIKELIDSEPPDRPFSDDDLAALLAASEIGVARRTVTKHRKELGIPSSFRRRRSWS